MLNKITEEAAYAVGAKGAAPTEDERKLFEAWMRGHCWAVSGTWDGTTYVGSAENGNYIDPHVMNTRQLWAAWRDRGSLTAPACLHQITEPAAQLTDAQIDEVFNRLPDGATGFLKAWGYQQFARELLAMHAPAQPAAFAALFAARGALQHIKESGKPTESLLNEAIAAIDSVAISQAAPAAVAVPDEREAFEAFARKYGTWDIKRDDVPHLGIFSYTDVVLVVAWHVWQARAALAATPAADAPAWDGKLPERLQIALNALRMECPAADIGGLEFEVRRTFEALETSRATAQRMFGAARDRLAEIDAMPFDPFAAAAPVVLPEPEAAIKEVMGLVEALAFSSVDYGHKRAFIDPECEAARKEAGQAHRAVESKLRALLATGGQAQAVERGEVLVTVSGFTGSGKSAIAGEIEILCRALGLQVEWPDGDSEKNMTHADWTAALEQYKPRVHIVEQNIPFAAMKGMSK